MIPDSTTSKGRTAERRTAKKGAAKKGAANKKTPFGMMCDRMSANDLTSNFKLMSQIIECDPPIIDDDFQMPLYHGFRCFARSKGHRGEILREDEFEDIIDDIRPVSKYMDQLEAFMKQSHIVLATEAFMTLRQFQVQFRLFRHEYEFESMLPYETILARLGKYKIQLSRCVMNVDGEDVLDDYLLGITSHITV